MAVFYYRRFDFYDTNLRWNYHISSNDKIRLNFLLLSNDLVFQENAVVSGNFTSRQSSVNQSSIAGGLFYDRKWKPKCPKHRYKMGPWALRGWIFNDLRGFWKELVFHLDIFGSLVLGTKRR